jgi:hypothetical protein
MRKWRSAALALALAGGLAACGEETDDQAEGRDRVVDIQVSEVSTACLRDLPEPNVESETPARLSLALENFSYSFEEGRNRYTHDRRFKETSGIGLYIYRGKVCVRDGEECADACVRYRVEPGGSLTQRGHHVATEPDSDRITLQYWARDDAGHTFTIESEIVTEGEVATASP